MTDDEPPFVGEPPDPPELPPPASAEPQPAAAVHVEAAPEAELPHEARARAPSFLGKTWHIFAAVLLVAGTLAAISTLLRPSPAGADAASREGAPAFVTLDGAELRRQPSASAETVATLSAGTRIEAFGTSGTWLEAESDGARGYLPVDVVERASDRDARRRREETLLAFAPVYGVVGEATDVILAPYPLAPRAGRLAKGTVVAIHSVDHSYFAFRDKTRGIAFVSSAAVDLIPPDPRQPAITPEKGRALKNLTIIDLEGEPAPDDEPLEELAGEETASSDAEASPRPPTPPAPPLATGLLEGPVVVSRVEPSYPDLARRAGIEGTVELEVSIDATGAVTDVEVVRGLPLGMSEAAADAVHRWKYKPARTAAGPVASRKSVRIRFVLRSE
jgi:protein TonB